MFSLRSVETFVAQIGLMALVNIAHCDVDIEAKQKSDITVFTNERDDSQLVNSCSFHDLPPELQCHLLRELNTGEIRELKAVSKQLKRLIERQWRPSFFILPPKIQLKILTETHMNSSEIRSMKLVSKDMKYLIERGARYLTKQNMLSVFIYELCTSGSGKTKKFILLNRQIASGFHKVTAGNMCREETVSLEDFSRIFTHCHFDSIWIRHINITFDFCDRLQDLLPEYRITCEMLGFELCDLDDDEIRTIVDKLLGATEASHLIISDNRNMTTVLRRNSFGCHQSEKYAIIKVLCLYGECDFSDDDLLATDYKILSLGRCRISEYALKQFLEVIFVSIGIYCASLTIFH
uniref:F-box domain-containing protein n=1 Tax=Heterorhabditis bacteriophora TaxID=37862 RepID=A0A1I7X3D0_HETBA